jgi:hypothetical protein
MPSVTVDRSVTIEQAADALRDRLPSYKVRIGGSSDTIRVSRGVASATVRANPAGGSTQFVVHGFGIIVTRLVNEFTLARRIADALRDSFSS